MARRTMVLLTLVTLVATLVPAAAQSGPLDGLGLTENERCDPIDPSLCLLPFPNDHFTRLDPTTDTGRRLNFSALSMPRNIAGKPIDPLEYNRNDGFSPGSMILTHVPGLDAGATAFPPITDIARSLDPGSPVVLLNARTGARHPFWAELDANATGDADRALIIRPAVNLDEGTRYIVALRNMRRGDGSVIAPTHAFRVYRDRLFSGDPVVEIRRANFEDVFARLGAAGVGRDDLYLAWDFTVASERNLSERILHMRDEAFASLQGAAPTFAVRSVTNFTTAQDGRIARAVEGTFLVPSYMNAPGGPPGSRMLYGLDGLPEQIPGNHQVALFTCNISRTTVADAADPSAAVNPGHAAMYGHGLLGRRDEVNAGNVKDMSREHNFVFCATEWAGMSLEDVPNVVHTLVDVSNFSTMADRMQQGFLNQLFLGRLMIHPQGLVSDPAFRIGGTPLIDTSALYYDGNSQGAIMGGALTALSQDFTRAVLGVPGMNYSTLLNRSVDFDMYSVGMYAAYPHKMEQQLIFSLIQILWDRGETNGYAAHVTSDPLPGTPQHRVLLHVAFGDHQVAPVSADVEARTVGAAVVWPGEDPGRHTDVDPYWGLPRLDTADDYPYAGSVMVVWDTHATPAPPITNTPPRDGKDPHSRPRSQASARLQKATFLLTGQVINVCGDVLFPAGHCHATP